MPKRVLALLQVLNESRGCAPDRVVRLWSRVPLAVPKSEKHLLCVRLEADFVRRR